MSSPGCEGSDDGFSQITESSMGGARYQKGHEHKPYTNLFWLRQKVQAGFVRIGRLDATNFKLENFFCFDSNVFNK